MKKMIIAILTMTTASAFAQMPVPLIDNYEVYNSAHWKSAMPTMQAALECREIINPSDPVLRQLLPKNDNDQWNLTPPKGFTVFGLPVQTITIYIDSSGELGASYTTTVAVPKEVAIKAANIQGERKTKIGSLMAEQGERPSLTTITCTVAGTSFDESN